MPQSQTDPSSRGNKQSRPRSLTHPMMLESIASHVASGCKWSIIQYNPIYNSYRGIPIYPYNLMYWDISLENGHCTSSRVSVRPKGRSKLIPMWWPHGSNPPHELESTWRCSSFSSFSYGLNYTKHKWLKPAANYDLNQKNGEKKGQRIGNHADNNAWTWMEYAENDVVQINSDLHPSDTEISPNYTRKWPWLWINESWYVTSMTGWWFQPLWKILVNGKDYPM